MMHWLTNRLWKATLPKNGRKQRRRPHRRILNGVQPLESREMFSNIVWGNRGTAQNDSDNFTAVYGNNAPAARAIVDAALDAWETVIEDFNYNHVGFPGYAAQDNTFQITFNAQVFGGSLRGQASIINVDLDGKPLAANIDLDDNGGSNGWFFDATPTEHAEFTNIITPFDATQAGATRDFYRTVAHEVGHVLGITNYLPNLAINNFLRTRPQISY